MHFLRFSALKPLIPSCLFFGNPSQEFDILCIVKEARVHEMARYPREVNMAAANESISGFEEDQVVQLLLRGEAQTLHEAEEKFLNAAIPDLLKLLAGSLRKEELARHPLLNLVLAHGSRGWEDSVL
jgi:hypothetical protein